MSVNSIVINSYSYDSINNLITAVFEINISNFLDTTIINPFNIFIEITNPATLNGLKNTDFNSVNLTPNSFPPNISLQDFQFPFNLLEFQLVNNSGSTYNGTLNFTFTAEPKNTVPSSAYYLTVDYNSNTVSATNGPVTFPLQAPSVNTITINSYSFNPFTSVITSQFTVNVSDFLSTLSPFDIFINTSKTPGGGLSDNEFNSLSVTVNSPSTIEVQNANFPLYNFELKNNDTSYTGNIILTFTGELKVITPQSYFFGAYYDFNGGITEKFGWSSTTQLLCLYKDTTVLTPTGYQPIFNLKQGDLVVTSENREVKIVKVYKSILPVIEEYLPYKIPKDFFYENYPPSDCHLSGPHNIQVKGKWFKPCYNKDHVKQIELNEPVVYYHIELENYVTDHLVINGGLVVESLNNQGENKERDQKEYKSRSNKLNTYKLN